MKRVFSSNSEVCHVWAQQTQSEGRAGSIYFEGDTIHSYGPHYKAAKIHTTKSGKRFALVNSYKYSVSTAKHLSEIRSALRDLMLYFECSDVTDPSLAVKELEQTCTDLIASELKTLKISNKDSISCRLNRIRLKYQDLNLLRELIGLKPKAIPVAKLKQVEKHLQARLARYHELNTPEMIAKREAKAARRQELKQAKLRASLEEKIAKFRAGETPSVELWQLDFDLLRVKGDELETSRHAKVPLREAKRLYKALKNNQDISNQRVGHYTIDYVAEQAGQTVVKVGCHKFTLDEIERALS